VLPVDFASLCATVEQVDGVRFRSLIEDLARGETDGDTLLKVVVESVHQAQAQEEAEPPAVSTSPAEESEEATITSPRPLMDDEDELPPVPSLRGQTAEAAAVLEDARTRRILFATNRAPDADVLFSGERRDALSFGSLLVRIPEEHDLGKIERPRSFGLFGWTLWRQQEDPERHFVLKAVRHLDADGFVALARENPTRAALVFVHGFNVSFTDGAFRLAQIVFDIQYEGIPVLFSWPAGGGVLSYFYDRESAVGSRERFTELLHLLQDQAEIQEIHVIAHSMGNQVVLEALAHAIGGPLSRPIGELITAAPDVDRDHYSGIAARVRAVSRGMTLYASSADKALITSRELAGIARAGDVGPDGPVVVDGIEAIDVTAIGTDMFSLNHSEFAHNRSLIDDIGRLLISGSRPPHRRSTQIRPVPEGSQQPVYWYYPS
jgi:esterase/lipase superfamily enzyme